MGATGPGAVVQVRRDKKTEADQWINANGPSGAAVQVGALQLPPQPFCPYSYILQLDHLDRSDQP